MRGPSPRRTIAAVPETILTEQRGDVLLITLNRPEKLNAWTTRMGRELKQAIGDANANAGIGAIVVTGAGPRVLCGGRHRRHVRRSRRATPRSVVGRRVRPARTSRTSGWSCASGPSRSSPR